MGEALKFEDGGRVLLQGRDLNAKNSAIPFRDGSRCIIEATSNLADRWQTKLAPNELRGVSGSDIPPGFEISIYRPTARTSGLDQLLVRNLECGAEIVISVRYYFQDWSYRRNLIHFMEDLRALVELKMPKCTSARVTRDEYGADIWCGIALDGDDDVYESFALADKTMTALYREASAAADRPFVALLEARKPSEEPKESELKWWVRFVAVPLMSGGLGAAIVGWLLLSK